MHQQKTSEVTYWLVGGLCAAYIFAIVAFFLHDLRVNPQFDNQVLRYAFELNYTIRHGGLMDILMSVRKYPLFYAIPLSIIVAPVSLVLHGRIDGILPFTPVSFAVGRLYAIAYAAGSLYVLFRISKRLFGNSSAVILLLTSILFFMFATAIRPHVAVTFWTLLALFYSLRFRESGEKEDGMYAFGSALLAFCTLQNGLLAFLFPLWAFHAGDFSWRRLAQSAGILVGCIALAIPFGYPFVLAPLLGYSATFGLDLGHNMEVTYTAAKAGQLLLMLIGSEAFILVFALLGAWGVKNGKYKPFPALVPIAIYIGIYTLFFAFQSTTDARFFMPLFPLLALIGAAPFAALPRWAYHLILALFIFVFLKFAYLAFQPSTYQQTTMLLGGHQADVGIIGGVPQHFYGLPDDALAAYTEDVRTVVTPASDMAGKDIEPGWHLCHTLTASSMTDKVIFLWNEVPWSLWHVFASRALGPNVHIYCADTSGKELPIDTRVRTN